MSEKAKSDKTVVALFDRYDDARSVVDDLVQAGVAKQEIALLSNHMDPQHPGLSNPSFARSDFEKPDADSTSSLGVGIEVGAGLGAILGLLSTVALPGIGVVVAAGAAVAMLVGAGGGAVVGGALGLLANHGVSKEDAHLYAEGLRRGGTLVTAHVNNDQVDRVTQAFKARGAVDIEKRGGAWRADGWVSFDMDATPLSASALATARESHIGAGHEAEHPGDVRHYVRP